MPIESSGLGTLRMPRGPPMVLLEQVGSGQDGDDLAEAQGGDGQVVAADAQDGQAQQDAEAHGHQHGEGDGDEEGPLRDAQLAGRGEQGHGVGADGEEGHEAEVEQTGQAQRDVETQAHQRVERDECDDRGDEAGEAERQQQHDEQHEGTGRDDDGRVLAASPWAGRGSAWPAAAGDAPGRSSSTMPSTTSDAGDGQAVGGEELARDARGGLVLQHRRAQDAGEQAHDDERADAQEDEHARGPRQQRQQAARAHPGDMPTTAGNQNVIGKASPRHISRAFSMPSRSVPRDEVVEVGRGVGQVVAQVDDGAEDDEQRERRARHEARDGRADDGVDGALGRTARADEARQMAVSSRTTCPTVMMSSMTSRSSNVPTMPTSVT